jgi:aryl-alcohol dehydrogenase-like predicted oxidoreductase
MRYRPLGAIGLRGSQLFLGAVTFAEAGFQSGQQFAQRRRSGYG